MPLRNVSATYLTQAADITGNPEQTAAYDSTSHCVVMAGPGSGKTKTLILKLARIMAEEVRAPRGAACITYSQECARELTRRAARLGLMEALNLFIGTVHGFCLRHLLLPYGRLADLPIPFPLTVANQSQSNRLMNVVGNRLFGAGHPYKPADLGRFRRSILDRRSDAWSSQEELRTWAEGYEVELRRIGLLDFDDLVIFGQQLVSEHDWVLPLIQAKFPFLVVDEYQDLGIALHRIVIRIVFDGNVRLFAVGDPDQSIYGFNGADGTLLQELTKYEGVEQIKLRLNYRSGSQIVNAAEMLLGETRGYKAKDPNRQAVIKFVKCAGGIKDQAVYAVDNIIPAALAAKSSRVLGDIAILYRDYHIGNEISEVVSAAKLDFVRVDRTAPYRKVALTSWIEDCAAWCSGGWRVGYPRLRDLITRWLGLHRASISVADARREAVSVTQLLWSLRTEHGSARDFVGALRSSMLDDLMTKETSLADQQEQVDRMSEALAPSGSIADIDIKELGGRDGSPNHLNLLTLHSAKGCEYDVVIIAGLDYGNLPWKNEKPEVLKESRRLFYVGLTRASDEIHMLYSGFVDTKSGRKHWGRSPFLEELEARMQEE